MSTVRRSIFRESAIKHYRESHHKAVLPRYVSPPVFLLLWLFFGVCMSAAILAWNVRIPTYASGLGTIVQARQSTSEAHRFIAVIFFSPDVLPQLRPGQSIQLQTGSTGPTWVQTITAVEPALLSPSEARERYHLDAALSLLITQPSAIIEATFPAQPLDQGSIVHGRVQVGSQRLLALLPLLNDLIGGER